MKNFKKIISVAICAIFVVALFGCTKKEVTNTKDIKNNPVELIWYVAGTPQKDQASVEEAVNKILKEKINATLKLSVIDYSSYDQKMRLKIASGETFDLCFTSFSWLNKYLDNVSKGAFLPLDDLLVKFAPNLYKSIPEKFWDATKVNGKIYASQNYQIMTNLKGFAIPKKFADKYGLKANQEVSISDIEKFMDNIKKNESGIYPIAIYSVPGHTFIMDMDKEISEYWDYPGAGSGAVKFNDKSLKLQTVETSPEYKKRSENFYDLMRKWYLNGYIRKDAASIQNIQDDIKAGKYALIPTTIKPGGDIEFSNKYGYEFINVIATKPTITTGSSLATMTALSRTTKNPERAMMLLELVNTDKELYNLLGFGIEGKHYKKLADGSIEKIEEGGYWSNISWQFGNQFNAHITKGQPINIWEETKELNESAYPSPFLGFAADFTNVKTVMANMQSISDEFLASLNTGSVDPAVYLTMYLEKSKKADPSNTVLTEMQSQIDKWAKSKEQ